MRLLLLTALPLASVLAASNGEFSLREQLGHTWSNEVVTFELGAAKPGTAVVGADGKAIPCQVLAGQRICFQADLSPYETRTYRFTDEAAKSDLQVRETGDEVVITNGRTGLKVRKKLKEGQGPIAGVKLLSGVWTGDSTFEGKLTKYEVEVKAKGPVFAEVECRAVLPDQGRWSLRFRVESGEPVVLVEEDFDAPTNGVMTVVLGDKAYRPTHVFHRNADVTSSAVMSDPLADYFLEPWLHWNNHRHGNWIALFTPTPVSMEAKPGDAAKEILGETTAPVKDPDMLMVGLLKPSSWVDPKWKGRAGQAGSYVQAKVRDGLMTLSMPVSGGHRSWMLGVLEKTASAEILLQKNRRVAPPPEKLVIKHGDFPLDRVKDYVLDWPGDEDNHPRLYVRKDDLPALRGRLTPNPAEIARWTSQQPIDKYWLDGPIREFVASGDPKLGKAMAAKAEEYLQICVDWYLKQDERQTLGAAPHMQTLIVSTLNLIDPVLSTEAFTPEARKRVLAKLAFLGYVTSSMDYWSPERGYSGFANMTSVVALYRAALGCMMPSHPQGKAWAELGLNQLRWQVSAWSDEEGGCLEAPHYAMVSVDHMLAGAAMAANTGYSDFAFDPRMRKVIEWFAGISTPRDSRTGGYRHQPPIGNTYHGEPTGVYGQVAALWKDRDPEFASQMQWLFEQHGSFAGLGIGWNFPSMLGYRWLMSANGVTPKPANFGSKWYPGTGVVLRDSMQSDRETYLHLIAGWNHDHYDCDSGSIIIYGKGRVLADDWGYIGRHPDRWHSMLTSGEAGGCGNFTVDAFSTNAALDYVSGAKGSWRRQIAFVKDGNPFFVMRDMNAGNVPATWRLWLSPRYPDAPAPVTPKLDAPPENLLGDVPAKPTPPPSLVTVHAQGATVSGPEDVDMDIFIYEAGKLNLATEEAKQSGSCGYRNGRDGPYQLAQTALTASMAGQGTVTAVLYPRLKTEPVPKVTWSDDGAVVKVETAAGTDCVFLTTKPPRVESDGKSLLPLDETSRMYECPGRVRGGVATPHLLVNVKETEIRDDKLFRLPAHSIAVHPGANSNAVTVVWQSPITGTVGVEARIIDVDAAAIGADAWRSDGVIGELRKGKQVLGRAVAANGGPEVTISADAVAVAKGELVRLVILPGASEWWDSTKIEFVVREAGGKQWDLREALLRGEKLGGDLAGDRSKAAWWVCEGDAETFDGRALNPPSEREFAAPDGKIRFQGTAGAVQIRGDKLTMTLGERGAIRVGKKELSAPGAAAKTETK